ncbi:MAG: hypothetical protein JWR63_2139 [Conexibacter sp.]|nr:hypothetical protein [Conexibacter sp.]
MMLVKHPSRATREHAGGGTLGLVVGDDDAQEVVDLAGHFADLENARLTVLGIARPAPAAAWCATFAVAAAVETLNESARDETLRNCMAALTHLPQDVPVTFRVLSGRPGTILPAVVSSGGFRRVVLHHRHARHRRVASLAARRWEAAGIDIHFAG